MVTALNIIGSALLLLLPLLPSTLAYGPLLPTITYGGTKDALFTVFTSTLINAPPKKVFDIVTDFKNYDQWNTFVTHVAYSGNLHVGTHMNFTDALIFPGTTYQSSEVFTVYDPDDLITAWRFDNTSADSYAEHVTQISTFGPNTALYLSWETYYGAGSALILATVGPAVQNAFVQQGLDLKAYAEV